MDSESAGGTVLRLRTDRVAWRRFEDELVLLDLRSSTYLATNRTATLLWERLEQGTTRDELVAVLVERYELEEADAARDVDAFLADCRARELVEATEPGPGSRRPR